MEISLNAEMLMSGASLLVTIYFWLIKANRERPQLEFFQLCDYRAACRSQPDLKGLKRLCLQQIDTGGVLVVNHSTRQNSVVLFDCYLQTERGEILGDWGYTGDDKPPWNIGPESTISFSPACFFDVSEDYEISDNLQFRIEFITASGKRFSHQFAKFAPRLGASARRTSKAA